MYLRTIKYVVITMLKKPLHILSFLLLLASAVSGQNTYTNPIINQSLPDPTVMRDADGTYWLYATEDIHNTPIYRSTNLVDWTFMGTAFTDASRPRMVSGGGIWAPEINYVNGQYVLYYSKSTWGGTWECGIGAATAEYPGGPFKDHGKLFISQEIDVENSIDPFFFSEDGHNYLFWGSFHGIYGIELSEDGLSVKEGAKKKQIASGFMEGTTIVKHDGWYFLIGSNGTCCEGAKSTYKVVVNRASKLFGPYRNREGATAINGNFSTMLTADTRVAGPGHNSRFVQDDEGQDWIIYHGYMKSDPDKGRVTFMDPIVWDKAGWPTLKTGHPSSTTRRPVIDPSMHEDNKSQVPLADPYILLDGDTYYAYGTHSADGIEVYVSNDLTTWLCKGLALNKENTTETKNFWAPEVYKRGDTYFMYYSANEHLFVATADNPLGPFVQQGGYLLNDLLGDEKCIDGSVFTDEDGRMYLYFVRFTNGNVIWECELAEDGLGPIEGARARQCVTASAPWEKKMGTVAEGPFVIKHNDRYYLTYSANDYQSPFYGIGYSASNYVDRGWGKYVGNPIICHVDGLWGTGHHSLFTDKEGNLRVVFHAHHNSGTIHPRMMYIGTMAFDGKNLGLADEPILRPRLTDDVAVSPMCADPEGASITSVYDASGQRVSASDEVNASWTAGIRIICRADGTTEKMLLPPPAPSEKE